MWAFAGNQLLYWWRNEVGQPAQSKPWDAYGKFMTLLTQEDPYKAFSCYRLADNTTIVVRVDGNQLVQMAGELLGGTSASRASTPASSGANASSQETSSARASPAPVDLGGLTAQQNAQLRALAGLMLDAVLPPLTPAQQELCDDAEHILAAASHPNLQARAIGGQEDDEEDDDEGGGEGWKSVSDQSAHWGQHHVQPAVAAGRQQLQRFALLAILEHGSVTMAEACLCSDGAKVRRAWLLAWSLHVHGCLCVWSFAWHDAWATALHQWQALLAGCWACNAWTYKRTCVRSLPVHFLREPSHAQSHECKN